MSGAKGNNKEAAAAVGKRLAERALAKGITKVHFDRNGRPYHGRIAALADGAREGGLSFAHDPRARPLRRERWRSGAPPECTALSQRGVGSRHDSMRQSGFDRRLFAARTASFAPLLGGETARGGRGAVEILMEAGTHL